MFVLGSFERVSSGLHFGVNLDSVLRGRVVIGAIVGARGAPECLLAGGSCESSSRGASEIRTGGGTLDPCFWGAQLPPPGPSPSTEKEGKRVDVYTRKYTLESIH